MEVIPAIDLLGGRCVRLYQGDFEQVTVYDLDPLRQAQRYRDAGMRRLHIIDLDGARSGELANLDLITEMAGSLDLKVQVGGGIRDLARLQTLLDAGVSRVVLGSVAATEPQTVIGWIDEVGARRIVLAIDVNLRPDGEPIAATHGWTESSGMTLWDLVDCYTGAGALDFLCTDIAKDGTLAGPNLALYERCSARYPQARFIASGGVSNAGDLPALEATGVSAVVTGKALLDGRLTLEEIEQFLQNG